MVFGLIVILSNLKVVIISNIFSLGYVLVIIASVFSYFITWNLISNIDETEINGAFE